MVDSSSLQVIMREIIEFSYTHMKIRLIMER